MTHKITLLTYQRSTLLRGRTRAFTVLDTGIGRPGGKQGPSIY